MSCFDTTEKPCVSGIRCYSLHHGTLYYSLWQFIVVLIILQAGRTHLCSMVSISLLPCLQPNYMGDTTFSRGWQELNQVAYTDSLHCISTYWPWRTKVLFRYSNAPYSTINRIWPITLVSERLQSYPSDSNHIWLNSLVSEQIHPFTIGVNLNILQYQTYWTDVNGYGYIR